MRISTYIILLLILPLMACTDTDQESAQVTPEVFTIKIGDSAEEYSKRKHVVKKIKTDKQSDNLNLYEKKWSKPDLGTVELLHGKNSFVINHVVSLSGVENLDFKQDGISKYGVSSAMTYDKAISHTEALNALYNIFKDLDDRGWKPLIYISFPRLQGAESYQYAVQETMYAPDPGYRPTLEQWMELGSFKIWEFYAGDVFLSIRLSRDSDRMDPEKEGAYSLRYTLHSADVFVKLYFKVEDRENWKALWVDMIKNSRRKRYKTEKILKDQGYSIFTDYEEPKVHPEDPVEP